MVLGKGAEERKHCIWDIFSSRICFNVSDVKSEAKHLSKRFVPLRVEFVVRFWTISASNFLRIFTFGPNEKKAVIVKLTKLSSDFYWSVVKSRGITLRVVSRIVRRAKRARAKIIPSCPRGT